MPEAAKIRILLADEDALRRDGLAAVLSGAGNFEVIGGAADGESALEAVRTQRPDVAVVDLNLTRLHGIELVRRIRAESLGTKVIIVAGTADDEIVREVVRAGADGYLLKNGPARHLIDAVFYVRDGGQYFSPQLCRDGRARHLLEEPARTWERPAAEPEPGSRDADDQDDGGTTRTARSTRGARGSVRPGGGSGRLRERLKADASSPDLDDHDYEIMTMMADGIRPILDRLDEIDSRVLQMEEGDVPVPSDPRAWLSTQLAETVRDPRGGTGVTLTGRGAADLEARLPELIEDAVTRRFHQMAGKLQQEIEETHVRTLEAFVKNIQVKLVQRVSALEHDMSKQAQAMGQLQEYSQRTEDNLSRLISGVDRLAQELPRRLAGQAEPPPPSAANIPPDDDGEPVTPQPRIRRRRQPGGNRTAKIFWASVGVLVLVLAVAWIARSIGSKTPDANSAAGGTVAASVAEKSRPLPTGADTKTKMQAAQESVDRKDYAVAEDIYKQIVKAEPNNADALKALASVLYREDKIEESAAVLDRLSKN